MGQIAYVPFRLLSINGLRWGAEFTKAIAHHVFGEILHEQGGGGYHEGLVFCGPKRAEESHVREKREVGSIDPTFQFDLRLCPSPLEVTVNWQHYHKSYVKSRYLP